MSKCIIVMQFDEQSPRTDTEKGLVERSGHRITVDDQYLYCWGGYNPDFWDADNDDFTVYPLLRELWRYNRWTNEWKKLETHGDVPTELASHNDTTLNFHAKEFTSLRHRADAMSLVDYCKVKVTAKVIKVQNHLLHFGGTGLPFGVACSNCLYDLNLSTLQWRRLIHIPDGSRRKKGPKPKYGHAMLRVDNFIYVVGGTSGFLYDMDVHRIDLNKLTWEHLKPTSRYLPEPRYRHEVVFHAGKIYLFGGGTALEAFDFENIDVFDINERSWECVKSQPNQEIGASDAYPTARRCHSCCLYQDYVYMCGGLSNNPDSIKKNIWKLHLPSLQWTQLQQCLPTPVYFHSAAISQDGCLYVFGGVTRVDDKRTNKLQIMWLNIPTLKKLSWKTVLSHLQLEYARDNKQHLLNLGVPLDLMEMIM